MATDNIETLLPQGQLRPDKEKGSFVLSKYFFVAPAWDWYNGFPEDVCCHEI
jgi:hypothetical protein